MDTIRRMMGSMSSQKTKVRRGVNPRLVFGGGMDEPRVGGKVKSYSGRVKGGKGRSSESLLVARDHSRFIGHEGEGPRSFAKSNQVGG